MLLATQTRWTLVSHIKYFGGQFTKRLRGTKRALRRCKTVTGPRPVTDGGLQVAGDTDEIDLASLRAQASTTPAEERDYCPRCETPKVFRKTGPADRRPNPEPWRCSNGHHFEAPATYGELDDEPKRVGQ